MNIRGSVGIVPFAFFLAAFWLLTGIIGGAYYAQKHAMDNLSLLDVKSYPKYPPVAPAPTGTEPDIQTQK